MFHNARDKHVNLFNLIQAINEPVQKDLLATTTKKGKGPLAYHDMSITA